MEAFSEPTPETWTRLGGLTAELFRRLGRYKPLNAAISCAKRHRSVQDGLIVDVSMQWGAMSLGMPRPKLSSGVIITARMKDRESVRHLPWGHFTDRVGELPLLVDAAVDDVIVREMRA